ncbi:hypothetical protein [Occultella kanbiaonis]|uniref:hypothetical protein n=1 Tax=Occultella kanbiaonis TaxID=2675754 RepID=UPI0013D43718|nr:hypothetical protein [Occultella kanbiaonis]
MQRSLGVAGLAGGLWLAGSIAAYADDPASHEQDSSTESSVAAPIELGGLSLGVETEDRSSVEQSSSYTDSDGNTTETESVAESSSQSDLGIDVGEISIDPAAMLATESSTSSVEAGDSGSTEGSQLTSGEVEAPVSLGGVTVTGSQQSASTTEESTTTTTDEGSASTSESTSESSATGGALEIGQLDIDPAAALSDDRESETTSTEGGVNDAESSSETSLEASSPITFEGIAATATDERSSEREIGSTVTDSEGTATTSETVSQASSNAVGVEGLDLAVDPMASVWNSTGSAATQARGIEGAESSASESDTAIWAGAPFHLGGITAAGESAQAEARQATSTVSDDEGTVTSTEQSWDATRTSFIGQTGDIAGEPWVWLTDTRSDASASAGDSEGSDSNTAQMVGYAFPFAIGDSGFASEIVDASGTNTADAITDENGTRTNERTTENQSVTRPGFVLDGAAGDPHGLLDTENAQRNRLV